MKTYINKLMILGALAFLSASCEEDPATTTLQAVGFSAPVQSAPATVILNADNKFQSVETISWSDVDFPVDAPVTYALQFDVASDTIGDNGWANAIRFEAGESVLSKSFLGGELNDLAHDLGLASDASGELVVRIEASLDRKVYSEAIVISVTPYTESVAFGQIYMPGAYQGWNPATAATLPAIDSGVYQGYLTFPAGQLEFKFTIEGNWDNFYGNDPSGNFAEGGDTNLSVPAAGSYIITVNLNTLTYTAVPYSWGIIGTATAGGWDSDTNMSYDYQNHVWKYNGPLVSGALKFRLNDSWTINYGSINSTEGVVYFDNPGAHTVPEAGNYEVTLDIAPGTPATATYTVIAQ